MSAHEVAFVDRYHGDLRVHYDIVHTDTIADVKGVLRNDWRRPERLEWHTRLAEFRAEVTETTMPVVPTLNILTYYRQTYSANVVGLVAITAPVYYEASLNGEEVDRELTKAQKDQLIGWCVRFAGDVTKTPWMVQKYEPKLYVARLGTWVRRRDAIWP